MSKRWMLFVDGENFTLEGEKLLRERAKHFTDHPRFYKESVFLWFPRLDPRYPDIPGLGLDSVAIRAYYYTAVTGSDKDFQDTKQRIWNLNFEPVVFKKPKGKKSKGVDIALTKDMLGHAHFNNYDVAVLIAGDGDYVPLVEEVKRTGKELHLMFFEGDALNESLKLASDRFIDVSSTMITRWNEILNRT